MIIEQCKVIAQFYRFSNSFALLDLLMGCIYLFQNPYRTCRKHFQRKKEPNVHLYGETPLTVWAKIVEELSLTTSDWLLDLGCGRGRICFWTQIHVGCRVTGVDWVESFITKASRITNILKIPHIRFSCKKISQVDLQEATVIYLYTFHPDEEMIDFKSLRPKTRVITVSEPLSQKEFYIQKSLCLTFPWGDADVFINEKL